MTKKLDTSIFFTLTKVDEASRQVWGRATEEVMDSTREICDVKSSRPFFEKWSMSAEKRSGGKSKGNIREMHEPIAAGKLIDMQFAPDAIDIGTYCSDDSTWAKILDGTLTGFSVGGSYAKRWPDPVNPTIMRYTADPIEISYVDSPAVPTATYKFIKADGVEEMRKAVLPGLAIPADHGHPLDDLIPSDPEGADVDSEADTAMTAIPSILPTSGNKAEEVPSVAGELQPLNEAHIEGVHPANVPMDLQTLMGKVEARIEQLTNLNKAEAERSAAALEELKQRGSSVGIARRDGEPIGFPAGYPTSFIKYGDPANYAFPCDTYERSTSAREAFNKGLSRDKYTAREWHTLGRRIARMASETSTAIYKYNPLKKSIERINKMTKTAVKPAVKKVDVMGLLSDVRAALSSANDQMSTDAEAAQALMTSVLGSLDEAISTNPVDMGTEDPEPPMDEQQDATIDSIKAAAVPPSDETPSAPQEPGEEMTEVMKAINALNNKFEAFVKASKAQPQAADGVLVGDLAAILSNEPEPIDPIQVAVDEGRLEDANVLAKGNLTGWMNKKVMESLERKPFLGAGHTIYNYAEEVAAETAPVV